MQVFSPPTWLCRLTEFPAGVTIKQINESNIEEPRLPTDRYYWRFEVDTKKKKIKVCVV
jgi:hypothetical protein